MFSGVVKAGLGIGGEHGEGALRVNGKTADYYSISAASIGLQIGAQKKDVLLLFMTDDALGGAFLLQSLQELVFEGCAVP